MEILYPETACVAVRLLATLEHASYLRRGKKSLPEPFVSDTLGEHSQSLSRKEIATCASLSVFQVQPLHAR
jgi:hypothetical protein